MTAHQFPDPKGPCSVCGVTVLEISFRGASQTCPNVWAENKRLTPKQVRIHLLESQVEDGKDGMDYVSVGPEKSTVDGGFTAAQLRKIADVMDQLQAESLTEETDVGT